MRHTGIIGFALALLILIAAPAADARVYRVADAGAGQGGRDCDAPLLATVQIALDCAAASAGVDVVQLGRGRYSERLQIRDASAVRINGLGPASVLVNPGAGRFIQIGLPPLLPDGTLATYRPGRAVVLTNLIIDNTSGGDGQAIQSDTVDVHLIDLSLIGGAFIRDARLIALRSLVTAPPGPCDAGGRTLLHLSGRPPIRDAEAARSVIWGVRTVGSHGGVLVDQAARVAINQSIFIAGPRCLGGGRDDFAQLAVNRGSAFAEVTTSSFLALHPSLAAAQGTERKAVQVRAGGEVALRQTTIQGHFRYGVDLRNNGWGWLSGVAVDTYWGQARDEYTIGVIESPQVSTQARWVYSSGPFANSFGGTSFQPHNRGSSPLALEPGGFPTLDSPVVDAVTNNEAENRVGDDGEFDLTGTRRPQAAIAGRPNRFDIGAYERRTFVPSPVDPNPAPPDINWGGPDWAGLGFNPDLGGFDGGIAGIGVPAPPGAPEAGIDAAAVEPGDVAREAEQQAERNVGPALVVRLPKRVRQGETVVVRVRVPWQGRLAVRVYGQRGGLVAVGKGRNVNRGWRRVKVRIGPNARVGTMRVRVTHVKRGRPMLEAPASSRILRMKRSR